MSAARNHSVSFVAVALLGAVGLISSLLPSWRATRIDPAKILRHG